MDKESGSMAKLTLIIMLLTVSGNAFGLVRESALAAVFGVSALTDAYKIAFIIPYILLSSICAAIGTTFIPVYADFKKHKSSEQIIYFVNNVFNTTIFVTMLLTFAGMLFAPEIVKIVAPGFEESIHDLASRLTVYMLPSIIFLALSNLSGAYLQSNRRFAAAAFISIPFNLIIIGCIVLPANRSIEIVAIGSMLGVFSQFLIQVPSMLKTGFRFRPVLFNFREEGLGRMCILMLPILIGGVFNQVYTVIERSLGSKLSEGSISVLDYAYKVNGTIESIFILSILTVTFPKLSNMAGDMESFKAEVLKVLKIVIYVTLPVMTGIFLLNDPVISILFERGEFSPGDTHVTAVVLGCLSLGVMGNGISGLLTKAFYSLKNTVTPVINTVISVFINILLIHILVRFWGVVGIALSVAFTSLLSCVMLLVWLKVKIGFDRITELLITVLKALCGVSVMGLAVYIFRNFYFGHLADKSSIVGNSLGLLLSTVLGLVIYSAMLLALRVEEADIIKKAVSVKMMLLSRPGPVTDSISKPK